MAQTVGFIGLGVMGRPMAGHVLAKGYPLVVHTRTPSTAATLRDAGARVVTSPSAVAAASDVIITMLPDSPDVDAVLTGPDGVLTALRPGAVVIDMSSISPSVTQTLAARVLAAGGEWLDAPVSGGEVGAVNAALSIMVGGAGSTLDRVRPILACMGHPDRIIHVGDAPGAGQICKLCNQIAIGGALAGVSEAFALAQKTGVPLAPVRQALLGGFAASRVLEVHGERMMQANYTPGFRTRLYQKDLRLAAEAAAAASVALPTTATVAQWTNALCAAGGAELDYSAIATVLFRLAGLEPQPR